MTSFDGKFQNNKIYKRCFLHFSASSNRFRCINISNFLPSKSRSRSRSTLFRLTPFDGKCQNLQKTPTHFFASSDRFRDIQILKVLASKVCWSQSTIFAFTPFDGKCQYLQKTPTRFCASSLILFQRNYTNLSFFTSIK